MSEQYLFVLEPNNLIIIAYDLIPFILAILEQCWKSKALSGYLVSVIGIHELIIVYTIRCISLDALDSRLTVVKRNDIVDKCLASGDSGEWWLIGMSCLIAKVGSVGVLSAPFRGFTYSLSCRQ